MMYRGSFVRGMLGGNMDFYVGFYCSNNYLFLLLKVEINYKCFINIIMIWGDCFYVCFLCLLNMNNWGQRFRDLCMD